MSIRNVITKIKVKKWIKDGLSVGENVKIEGGGYQLIRRFLGWLLLETM